MGKGAGLHSSMLRLAPECHWGISLGGVQDHVGFQRENQGQRMPGKHSSPCMYYLLLFPQKQQQQQQVFLIPN